MLGGFDIGMSARVRPTQHGKMSCRTPEGYSLGLGVRPTNAGAKMQNAPHKGERSEQSVEVLCQLQRR